MPFSSKILLFSGFLLAAVNLYGQRTPQNSSQSRLSSQDGYVFDRSSRPATKNSATPSSRSRNEERLNMRGDGDDTNVSNTSDDDWNRSNNRRYRSDDDRWYRSNENQSRSDDDWNRSNDNRSSRSDDDWYRSNDNRSSRPDDDWDRSNDNRSRSDDDWDRPNNRRSKLSDDWSKSNDSWYRSNPPARSNTSNTSNRPNNIPASRPSAQVRQPATSAFCRHEFSLWGGIGLSSLYYEPTFGQQAHGFGGVAGLGYTVYFSKSIGLLIGGEFSFLNSSLKIDQFEDRYKDPEIPDVTIDYIARLTDYTEKQRLVNFNIPLALQIQAGETHKFYASVGLKIGVPVSARYQASGASVKAAYYDNAGNEIPMVSASDPVYDPARLNEMHDINEKMSFKTAYIGALELGAKWRLGRTVSLYTGLFAEYGFNDIVDKHDKTFIYYDNSQPGYYNANSVLVSQYTNNRQTESFVKHVSPLAVGFKLRLGFNLCGKSAERGEQPVKKKEKDPAFNDPDNDYYDFYDDVNTPRRRLTNVEIEEDLRRAVSEYGTSVRGVVNVELEGFELAQSFLSKHMERVLDEKIAQIRKTYGNNISIICEGHTCNTGSMEYNMRLGLKRANIVRDYLIKSGYRSDRVVAISKGPLAPIAPNDTEANRKKNRRVVLIVKGI